MQKIKRFIKTAFIYFAGNMLSKMVAFFLLPLYTSHLPPNQYGTYDLVISLINLVAPIAFFQIWDGMFRFAFDYPDDKDKYSVINNTIVTYGAGVPLYIILFCILNMLFHFDNFALSMIYGFFFSMQYMYTYIARLFLRNKLFVLSGTVNTLVSAVINIVLIVKFNFGVESLYIAPTIGCLLQIIIIESQLKVLKHFKLSNLNKGLINEMLRFSLPLCIATISYWLLSGFTKVIITNVLGAHENGMYAVANRFASMITLLVTVFQYAWNEMAYLMSGDKNRQNLYSICVDIIIKVVLYGCAAAFLIIKLVYPYMIDVKYEPALLLIPAAVFGVSMNSVAGFLGTLFMTEKKTNFILYSTLISAMLNCVFGYIAAVKFGLMGTVVVLALSFTVLMVLRLVKLSHTENLVIDTRLVIQFIPLIGSILVFYNINSLTLIFAYILLLLVFFMASVSKYFKMIVSLKKDS